MKKIILLCLLALSIHVQAQNDTVPLISIFRPFYFIGGFPTNEQPASDNFELKFQYSVRLNLWHNIGNKDWDAFFGYSQISLWDFFGESSPFRDNMFMPGLYCSHNFCADELGNPSDELLLGIEHRSNGKIGYSSRSLNYLFAEYSRSLPCGLSLLGAARIGYGHLFDDDPTSMRILNQFLGYFSLGAFYRSNDDRWTFGAAMTPHFQNTLANLQIGLSYRFTHRHDFPRLYVQYHYGYDEALIDCRYGAPPTSFLRFGLIINPQCLLFL